MGRTKRERRRRRATICSSHSLIINCAPNIISLKQWMKGFGWKDCLRLKLRHFESTNRGLFSTKNIFPGDRLIEIPCELLVTAAEIDLPPSILLQAKEKTLKTQELLALFLVVERRKRESSTWKWYLQSLPEDIPPVPWLCGGDEIKMMPWEFRNEVEKRHSIFETGWERVRAFVTLDDFIWAYVMVNTRAVYVDPTLIKKHDSLASDEPSMALCPYLDMFNHSCDAVTSASVIYENHSWRYVLTTSDRYSKYEQVYISYGAHDNNTLMSEYGFFIPGNPHDSVSFTLEEILSAQDRAYPLSKKQFNFIRNDRWTANLHVSVNQGLSFNLKAVLYVILNDRPSCYWNEIIFSGNYSRADFKLMHIFSVKLLKSKLEACALEVKQISEVQCKSVYLQNVLNYLKYRVDFVRKLLRVTEEKIYHLYY